LKKISILPDLGTVGWVENPIPGREAEGGVIHEVWVRD